jgi:hypothetical protein
MIFVCSIRLCSFLLQTHCDVCSLLTTLPLTDGVSASGFVCKTSCKGSTKTQQQHRAGGDSGWYAAATALLHPVYYSSTCNLHTVCTVPTVAICNRLAL